MHEWLRETTEKLEAICPHVWSVCYPQHILTPNGFTNPKYHAAVTAGHLKMMEELGPESPPAHTMVALSSLCLVRYRVPTYFVEEEFADAVAHIRLPEGMRFSELRWPLEAFLFALPEAWSRRYFGWHIPFLSIARLLQGQHPNMSDLQLLVSLQTDMAQLQPCTSPCDRIVMAASYFPDDGWVAPVDYTADYPLKEPVTLVREAPFSDATPYERQLFGTKPMACSMPNSEEDKVLSHAIVEFGIKLLLAITARPTVVRNGTVARAAKAKKGRTRTELWHPSMIGTGYRVARPAGSLDGTHASPRLHWRWGHYTHQRIGKRAQADFVSVADLPRTQDGKIAWDQVTEETRVNFWKYHELKLIDPILVMAHKNETNK